MAVGPGGRVSREADCWGRWPLQHTLVSLPSLSEERPQQENFTWKLWDLCFSTCGVRPAQDVASGEVPRGGVEAGWQLLPGKCPHLGEQMAK